MTRPAVSPLGLFVLSWLLAEPIPAMESAPQGIARDRSGMVSGCGLLYVRAEGQSHGRAPRKAQAVR